MIYKGRYGANVIFGAIKSHMNEELEKFYRKIKINMFESQIDVFLDKEIKSCQKENIPYDICTIVNHGYPIEILDLIASELKIFQK